MIGWESLSDYDTIFVMGNFAELMAREIVLARQFNFSAENVMKQLEGIDLIGMAVSML